MNTFQLYISYSQFFVSDSNVNLVGLNWTEKHTNQGFAKNINNINCRSLMEYGTATVQVFISEQIDISQYDRVISHPFFVDSGCINIDSVEADQPIPIPIDNGIYKTVVAQRLVAEDLQLIDIYFYPADSLDFRSQILLMDDALAPEFPLIEEATTA